MIETRWGVGLAGVVALGMIGLFGFAATSGVPFGLDHVSFAAPARVPAWPQRIARVDAALERSALSPAIYEWREAYSAAVRARSSEGLIAVADRAVQIAELTGGSGYFLTEARYIYMHAALRARAEHSRQTILGIAETFDRLGDTERAGQVRRIAANVS